jgi:predicted  nucleic acid-binding Zn-ribbon protein
MANKTCRNCGEYYSSTAAFCPSCGEANNEYRPEPKKEASSASFNPSNNSNFNTPTQSQNQSSLPQEGDTFGYAVLGFFFGFVGIILYFALRQTRPKAAQSSLNGALTAIVLVVIASILSNL